MSNTESLFHNSPYTNEQVASRTYNEMWEPYLNMGKSMCIFAPRRSGKSFALMNKFAETTNSVYITANLSIARDLTRDLRRQGVIRDINYDRDVFSHSTAYRLEARRLDRIFIDEVCHFRSPFHELLRYLIPQMEHGAIVTMSTSPSGRASYEEIRSMFSCVSLPQDWIMNHRPKIENYFEEGLFEI